MSEEEEAEPHWLAKWEEGLPRPEELMPLSQSLITHHLAVAFDIPTTTTTTTTIYANNQNQEQQPSSATKKPRLVWTPQLHKRFVEAISRLGIKNAVPKTIMQLMNVEGLTRENVASHLQKYRLYLKRMHSSTTSSSLSSSAFILDAATERLFAAAAASAPLPPQFFGPFMPVAAMQQYRPIASMQQNRYYHQQKHPGLVIREPPSQLLQSPGMQRFAHQQMLSLRQPLQSPYLQYLSSGGEGERRALKLFPTGLD